MLVRLRQACAAGKLRLQSHCEEQSDEAIQFPGAELDCFASLAMMAIYAIDSPSKSAR
jgi:hypothetical protein